MAAGSDGHQQSSHTPNQQTNLVRFANIKARYCRRMRVVLVGGIYDAEEAAGGFKLDDFPSDRLWLFAGHGYAAQEDCASDRSRESWSRVRQRICHGHGKSAEQPQKNACHKRYH